jgi:hypothetical protein
MATAMIVGTGLKKAMFSKFLSRVTSGKVLRCTWVYMVFLEKNPQ